MLDKSKKVGRFRRRERGVSHVLAIFFWRTNFSTISRIVFSTEIYTGRLHSENPHGRVYARSTFSVIVVETNARRSRKKINRTSSTRIKRSPSIDRRRLTVLDRIESRFGGTERVNAHRRIRIAPPPAFRVIVFTYRLRNRTMPIIKLDESRILIGSPSWSPFVLDSSARECRGRAVATRGVVILLWPARGRGESK